jgi:spore germination protein GerM
MKRLLIAAFPMLFTLACIASTPTAGSITVVDGTPAPTLMTPSPTAEIIDTTAVVETPAEGMVNVWVFFTMAADENMTPVPAARSVPQTDNEAVLVRTTLKELLKGPTDAEKAAGLISWFSPATADAIAGVAGVGGEYTVDFTGLNTLIPNASTSAGSQMLMSQLNSTVFQFDFVQSVGYTLDGDCAAFWEWLQMGCHTVSRAEWEG